MMTYIIIIRMYTYHTRFIPEDVAEVSQIFLRDTHVLPKFVSNEEHCRRDICIFDEMMTNIIIIIIIK
jgi:hypothetical protein